MWRKIVILTVVALIELTLADESDLIKKCSDQNEIYKCASACQIECATLGQPCLNPSNKCISGCYCKTGYARDDSGRCISIKTCPLKVPEPEYDESSRCGHNEIYKCGSACQTTCETLGQTCPIVNIKCNNGCYCKDGYARDNSGTCIPIKTCPLRPKPEIDFLDPPICTGPNAKYRCANPCQTDCADLNKPCSIHDKTCKYGCYCDKDYVRYNGKCILKKNCPKIKEEDSYIQDPEQEQEQAEYEKDPEPESVKSKQCTGRYEVFNECGSKCKEKCGKDRFCPAICNIGCFCKAGYSRDLSGNCIPNKKCSVLDEGHTRGYENRPEAHTEVPKIGRQCNGQHEVTACEKCPKGNICPHICKLICECKAGYKRNNNGKCIPNKNYLIVEPHTQKPKQSYT